jgi:hypothetical protein
LRTMHLLATAIAVPFLAVAAFAAQESSARADGGTAFTYAVYGDAPYGAANHDVTQVLRTPAFIDSVNADPDVSRVIHVGDIHSGKDHCYQAYNTGVYDLWQGIPFTISGSVTNPDGTKTIVTDAPVDSAGFDDPLVYTPGDNEWTDCNKSGEGGGVGGDGYLDSSQGGHLPGDPLDNLAIVRGQFFQTAGQTLGSNRATVTSQAVAGPPKYRSFVENVRWEHGGAMFVTVDLPGGSNNDATPWFGAAAATQRQLDEKALRTAADLQWLAQAFALAESHGDRGVVIAAQADMWDPEAGDPGGAGLDQYDSIVNTIAKLTREFNGQVLMLNGDSHVFQSGNPLSSTSPLFKYHPQKTGVPNFTRIVVHGSTLPLEWLKLTIDTSTPAVFSWQEMPFG